MGRTKAVLEYEGRPMGARVADALADAGCEPVVLVGGAPDELAPLGRPLLADLHPGAGPVGGVVTALVEGRRIGADAVAVVACDLPRLDGAVVRALREALAATPDAAVAVARTDRIEPACALWRTDAVDRVEAAFAAGTRALHLVIDAEVSVEVDVDSSRLRNVNTPEDLPG
jgi:molybdopterin-guanine dinucleotide biosynthesis protein A